uniref:G-protein coupled receptors family 1 profile domain-containing protein n=1 Tax=Equus asinus TaxID=9793 RepID=A0A8C4PUJ8_EQUAS
PYILIYFTNLALLPILLSCINRLVYDLKLVTFDFYPCYLIIFRFFKTRILGHNIVLTVFMIGKILVPGLKQINAFCCSNIELNVNSLNKICHSENSMASGDLVVGMLFFVQTIVGIGGNFYLLYHYLFFYVTGYRLRSTDLILTHLTVANLSVILSKGVFQTMLAFGLKHFLNDFGCKLVFYVYRVGSGVTIGSTCLLSVFQAIIISPRNSWWANVKAKAPRYMGITTIFCWIMRMLLNIIFPMHIMGKWSNTNITMKTDLGYCSFVSNSKMTRSPYAALISLPDVLCLGLMIWASGSTVFILHRHKQRLQHIHRTNVSSRSSPESRATQSILILVSAFVSCYSLSCICEVCLTLFKDLSQLMLTTSSLIVMCFPTLSPFLLMSRDSSVSWLCFAWISNTKIFSLIRNV